jgi:chorismate mutase
MKSIRGAIAVVENNEESIMSSAKELINEILIKNSITENDIEFAIFTVTPDISKAFPAKAFRELEMTSVAAIDTLAPNIDGDLSGCIRILIYLNKDLTEVSHVYLDDAKKLRPDR